ncbi:fused MFS/spermidine synthase [Magnetofaba australis]|uniref:Putative spermidine synthase n=1 Tax=Magnetofaba australis IT-1 TaxID=1434232 RepID=A0A1Y2K5K5_9PROT|nr:fused MFS/spermidine synthase [Magnetofaba australis]OSM04964.1 putative spermidine synthase [Magnetofaba australis IT-1]
MNAAIPRPLFRDANPERDLEVVQCGDERYLHFGDHLKQSAIDLARPDQLALSYSRLMMTALVLMATPPQRILMIGLGGGSMARFLWRALPQAHVTVVERDPVMARVAFSYFELPQDPRLMVRLRDGARAFEPSPKRPYDLILLDAFDPSGLAESIHCAKFLHKCRAHLSSDGVLAVNLTRSNKRRHGQAVNAIKAAFPEAHWRLPVAKFSNELRFAKSSVTNEWLLEPSLRTRAQTLNKELSLDFPGFLAQMKRVNFPLWRRLRAGR